MTVLAQDANRTSPLAARNLPLLPGLALTGAIAGTALALREIPYIGLASPMILAIGIGIAIQNTSGTSAAAKAGITFSMRSILRFAHTGEVLGFAGQTIAGLVSLGATLLVYTGLALSWRRFWSWRRRTALPSAAS